MEYAKIQDALRSYIEDQLIDAPGTAIDPDTPLLEWGILNSMSTTRLVSFIRESLGIDVPAEEMVGENFRDLTSITRLVSGLADARDLV